MYFIGYGGIIGGDVVLVVLVEVDVILVVGCCFLFWMWDEGGVFVKGGVEFININIDLMSFGVNVLYVFGIWVDVVSVFGDFFVVFKGCIMFDWLVWL